MEWYKLEIEKILNEVKGSLNGLSNEEAKKRIEKYGLNELPKKKKDGPLKIFLSEFNDPIIWLLLIAIIFSFIVGEVIDAIAILFIVLVDAILGTVQEWKAGKSAEALENLIKVSVKKQ